MSQFRRTRQRSALIATAATAALALTATPALAGSAKVIVHPTPETSVVVDGVKYAPEQIHRFDGRPLYMRLAKDGKSLVAYTKLSRFKQYLSNKGVSLPSPADVAKRKARASGAGHWTKFCTDRYEQGWCHTINSGWGLANTRALNGCNIFGACWNYDDNIEWMRSSGPGALLYDWANFNPGGGMFALFNNETIDLTFYGWANRVESLYQPW